MWLINSTANPKTSSAKNAVSIGSIHGDSFSRIDSSRRRFLHLTTNSAPSPTTPTMTITKPNSETDSQKLSDDESRKLIDDFYRRHELLQIAPVIIMVIYAIIRFVKLTRFSPPLQFNGSGARWSCRSSLSLRRTSESVARVSSRTPSSWLATSFSSSATRFS